jgi:hypothetical protein
MTDLRREIEANVCSAGLYGFTCKLEIVGQDVYVKVALHQPSHGAATERPEPRLSYVDVTLSSPQSTDDILVSHRQTLLETTKTDDARAMIELLCRQANALLQSGAWNWDDLCETWIGTRFDPCGACRFPVTCSMPGALVSSPLDAVARVIRDRFPIWGAHVALISQPPRPLEGT